MLLIGKSYGFEGRNLCFCFRSLSVSKGELAEDGTLAGGLYVVQPLAVVAHAAARARLHEF